MNDYKKDEVMKAIYLNVTAIENYLKQVDFKNKDLREELLEMINDVTDMRTDFNEITQNINKRFDLIERIVEDHLHHISTITDKSKILKIVK